MQFLFNRQALLFETNLLEKLCVKWSKKVEDVALSEDEKVAKFW